MEQIVLTKTIQILIKENSLKKIFILIFSFLYIFAKEVPIENRMEVFIPVGEWSVFEFPFKMTEETKYFKKIEKKKVLKKLPNTIDNDEQKVQTPTLKSSNTTNQKLIDEALKKANNDNNGKNPEKQKSGLSSSFEKSSSDNIVKIFPKVTGETEMIVWGYEYPIMIKINVVDPSNNVNTTKYLKFLDYEIDKREAVQFEVGYHEKTIEKLLYHMWNEDTPKGYKLQVYNTTYKDNKDLEFEHIKSYVGYNYVGQVWGISNTSKETITLYEEMFANESIYLIAFDGNVKKGDRVLLPNESIKMFIVMYKE